MLSIGKLAVGQADYYLEQAQGSVTRARAVASGVEDYYLHGAEAPGEWVGDGTRALRLGGTVDAMRLDRVLSGCAPASGEPLGRVVPRRVPGFDLTFSAPKSVSVLFGVGDDGMPGAIQDAHDQAVVEALAYVSREAGVTRRGAGGAVAIAGRGLIGAAFRHRTSRAGDPQLHTHVLVANLVLGADGRWGTLDGRRIYAHAKTAGYLYEHRLRALLTRELGFAWEPVRNGIADVAGVGPEVRRAFSRDVDELLARLAGPEGLTKERSSFARREVLQALAEGLPSGANVRIGDLERIADRFLASERVVVLAEGDRRGEVVDVDGRVVPGLASERRYSTPALLERERRVLDYAEGDARPESRDGERERRRSCDSAAADDCRRASRDGAAPGARRRRRGRGERAGWDREDVRARCGA